jgi:glutathione S-transferase
MSTLRLWGRANSGNVQKPMWLLDEIGINYERLNVGGSFGGTDTRAYLAMNPNARVPVLEDGDTIIWESNTIVRYLAAVYGGERFWIAAPDKRATAEMWMDWAVTTLKPQVTTFFHAAVRTPLNDQNPAHIDMLSKGSIKVLALINQHLKKTGQDWISGDQLSIGDIPIGTQLFRYFDTNPERPAMPYLEAYYARMCKRTAYRDNVMVSYDDLIGVPPFSQIKS